MFGLEGMSFAAPTAGVDTPCGIPKSSGWTSHSRVSPGLRSAASSPATCSLTRSPLQPARQQSSGNGGAKLRYSTVVAMASSGRSSGNSSWQNGGGGCRNALAQYVSTVQPNEVQTFIEQSSPSVVAAMKHTVSNMVGTLPPQHFGVTINTAADSLATLMHTMLRTGYLLRSAQFRLELHTALSSLTDLQQPSGQISSASSAPQPVPLPASNSNQQHGSGAGCAASHVPELLPGSPADSTTSSSASMSSTFDDAVMPAAAMNSSSSTAVSTHVGGSTSPWAHPDHEYAPGVQKTRVEGEVLRWHMSHGIERLPARQYIDLLEEEVATLRSQLQQQQQGSKGGGLSSAYTSWPTSQQPLPPMPPPAQLPGATSGANAVPAFYSLGSSVGAAAMGAVGAAGGVAAAAASAAGAAAAAAAAGAHLSGIGNGGGAGADLLAYLRSLEPSTLAALGACGVDVADAMATFVCRLMGTGDKEQLRAMSSEFTAVELSKLLFWLLVVGWSLRALEVRWEMEEGFAPPAASSPATSSQDDLMPPSGGDGWRFGGMLPGN